MNIDGGSLAQDQKQNPVCYAYADTRMILNLMKNLEIIDDIKKYPDHLNALNKIEYSFMDINLPQVNKFINGNSEEFNEINKILKTNDINKINEYYTKKNETNQKINTINIPKIKKIDTEIDKIKKDNEIIKTNNNTEIKLKFLINTINKKSEEEIFNNMMNAKQNEIEINIINQGNRREMYKGTVILDDDVVPYTYIFNIFQTKLKDLDENTLENVKQDKIAKFENLINTQTAIVETQKKISLGTDFEDLESFRNKYNKMIELKEFTDKNKKNPDVDVKEYNDKLRELEKLKDYNKNISQVTKLNKDISKLEELNEISLGLSIFTIEEFKNVKTDISKIEELNKISLGLPTDETFKKLKTNIDKLFEENGINIPKLKIAFHLLYIDYIEPLINDAITKIDRMDNKIYVLNKSKPSVIPDKVLLNNNDKSKPMEVVINSEKIKLNNIFMQSELNNNKLVNALNQYIKDNKEIYNMFTENDELFENIKAFIITSNGCGEYSIIKLIKFILVLKKFNISDITNYISEKQNLTAPNTELEFLNIFLNNGGIQNNKEKDMIDVIRYFKEISEKIETLTFTKINPDTSTTVKSGLNSMKLAFGINSLKQKIIHNLKNNNYILLSINANIFYETAQKRLVVSLRDINDTITNNHGVVITNYRNGFITIKNSWGTYPEFMFIGKKIVDIDFFLYNDIVKKAEFFVFKYTLMGTGKGGNNKNIKNKTKTKTKRKQKKRKQTKRKQKKRKQTNKKYK